MAYAEVIYETGAKSIVSFDDIDALRSGLKVQHDRAVNGQEGGPTGHAAERVKRVLLYDTHPGELYANGSIPVELFENALDGCVKDGSVNIWDIIEKARLLASPITNAEVTGPHDSMYLADEVDELDMAFLNTADGEN